MKKDRRQTSRWRRLGVVALSTAALGGCLQNGNTPPPKPADTRPNVLLIVADDLGYSDIGAFGGEISTPNLGRPLSNVSYGRRWAEVGATPFRLWKGNPTEGGVVVPAIARLPKQIGAKAALTQFTSVTDLAPTLLELAKAPNPGSQHKGKTVNPITGVSLLPALDERGKELRAAGTVIADELHGGRYVRRDNWKISWVTPPAGPGRWELFDLATDRGEITDVASANPQVVSELTAQWDAYVQRVGLILPVWQ
ncbi:hypothetical protein EBB06_14340 [Crenobacter cavernae]|uniref:Sulfatase N-terminal domain-containing protein n=1 Tax=Crenobacter cavernae TaxID=2290923 RepID=A0ABY0F9S1_9NEIS|nr:sulfatase-like hydrolase/transferase [Crenobacter cavernae]RXZ42220.1 hypothetical protein EBB06_14340 [Crenobacter cavernae]